MVPCRICRQNLGDHDTKLLVIYTFGDDGKIEHTFRPIYDGTLGDCNTVFEMLVGYLAQQGQAVKCQVAVRPLWINLGQQ